MLETPIHRPIILPNLMIRTLTFVGTCPSRSFILFGQSLTKPLANSTKDKEHLGKPFSSYSIKKYNREKQFRGSKKQIIVLN